jgi:hypothetical protein
MEYVCNNQASIATKIFELGLKAFPEEVPLAIKFLQFQLQINDEASGSCESSTVVQQAWLTASWQMHGLSLNAWSSSSLLRKPDRCGTCGQDTSTLMVISLPAKRWRQGSPRPTLQVRCRYP